MASNIPAGLKAADVGRFAVRAAQLKSAKPIIAYWCNFWIVNQIIERGLHTSDDEVKLYTVNLMEELEQFQKFKSENPDNDAVLDAVAANAYVEQFGLEVFARAEATMTANKVTRQTADTFQAAATFLELCQIWNPPDAEIAAKIKFAKYHALRIVKAIKVGEDPNASNPVIQEAGLEELGEVTLEGPVSPGLPHTTTAPEHSKQPFVEEVMDESEDKQHSVSQPPVFPQPPNTSSDIPSAPPGHVPTLNQSGEADDSPLNLPSAPQDFTSSKSAPELPDTPTDIGAHHTQAPQGSFQSFPPPSGLPTVPPAASHDRNHFYNAPASSSPPPQASRTPSGPSSVVSRPVHQPYPIPTPHAPVSSTPAPDYSADVDDRAIAQAQKHARWAVSALAFDDVNTAIKELKNSLRHLGA